MALVAHKFMPEQMSEREIEGTFAAREHTLDYLIEALRKQLQAKKLTSYLITGPRGVGKTTLVLMMCLRLRQEPKLNEAWLPVRFPEEAIGVNSLRDLLSRALDIMADDGVLGAGNLYADVEAETDDEQSLGLAITGLRKLSKEQGKRLILFVENLDQVFARGLDEQAQATLRRLLMVDPFMLVIGTAVRLFEELQSYDEALFNFFCPVPLERLNDDQVRALIFRRADFDGNPRIAGVYQKHQAKIKAISRLTGGNPRLILMLYEVLSLGDIRSCVHILRQLVDELTPLLKNILENQLTGQQSKIVDAIMRAGGVSTPRKLAKAARLPLNVVTSQLQRLKKSQLVEAHGGGKGRTAYYSVIDQLFRTWYQMRYLRPNHRRIEMFVEILRIWFEEEERLNTLQALSVGSSGFNGRVGHDTALAAEYMGASLTGTQYESLARELVVNEWLKLGEVKEAALALAENDDLKATDRRSYEAVAYIELGKWSLGQGDLDSALASLHAAVEQNPHNAQAWLSYGHALLMSGDLQGALRGFDHMLKLPIKAPDLKALALCSRGITKGRLDDPTGAIADLTAVIELDGAPVDQVATALSYRAFAKGRLDDLTGAIADYTAVIELDGTPVDRVTRALSNRGVAKGQLDDLIGGIADYTAVIELDGAPVDQVATALVNRGITKGQLDDPTGAITDLTVVIELDGAPVGQVATALVNRGVAKGQLDDLTGGIADYTAVIELDGAPVDQVAPALVNRGITKGQLDDPTGAITDLTAVIELDGAPVDQVGKALSNRGVAKGQLDDLIGEIADYTAVIELDGVPVDQVGKALSNRGVAKGQLDDLTGEIADYIAVAEASRADLGLRAEVLAKAVRVAWRAGAETSIDDVLHTGRRVMASLSGEERLRFMSDTLLLLAMPDMKREWPRVLEQLAGQQPESADEFEFFKPIAEVLRSGDRSRLDPLPPEQREFAEDVLKKFKDEDESRQTAV